jgi:hypothetical protein
MQCPRCQQEEAHAPAERALAPKSMRHWARTLLHSLL